MSNNYYKPKNKQEREARRMVWERFIEMRDDPRRKEAEEQWDLGDKMFLQWTDSLEDGDPRANITLPDGFAAVQTHMQETIERRSRPVLKPLAADDLALEAFGNSVLNYSMDMTGYDYQDYLAKQTAAIRGTSFVMEYWRTDKRVVKDLTGVNDDGSLKYEEKEIVDFDDAYTEWVDNEFIFLDPGTHDQNAMRDCVYREIIDHDEFVRDYSLRPDFMNVDKVPKSGAVHDNVRYFERAKDLSDNEVEVLHYYNRAIDAYYVLANNVLIRMTPLPSKHKELPVAVHVHYNVPGRMYGLGIPYVIFSLTEERRSLRNLHIDRNNLNVNKMFLVNDLVDLDEEDTRSRPNGFIPVNTNGMRLNEVIQPLEYGDTPISYFRTEEMLLEDIRRAHGLDDRLQGNQQTGSTATEAAILKEASQRRINLINSLAEMNTIIRIGRMKWSNIQFFYPESRIKRLMVDEETRSMDTLRTVRVEGKKFEIKQNQGTGKGKLVMNDIDGTSSFKLDKKHARFIKGQWDVVVSADSHGILSKPLKQAKITEMFNLIGLNPQLAGVLDPHKSVKRYISINEEDPKAWMRENAKSPEDWQREAMHENIVMAKGQYLPPTEGATEQHTMAHLAYMNTDHFKQLIEQNPAIEQIFEQHVFGEHQNNPDTAGMEGDMFGDVGEGDDLLNAAQAMAAGGGLPDAGGGAPVDIQPNFE